MFACNVEIVSIELIDSRNDTVASAVNTSSWILQTHTVATGGLHRVVASARSALSDNVTAFSGHFELVKFSASLHDQEYSESVSVVRMLVGAKFESNANF